MTASDEAKKRIADYLARRARANGFDKEEIHTFDAGCNGQTVLLTSDLTALLAENAAKDAALAIAMEALNELARHPEDEGSHMPGDFRSYYRDTCTFAKQKVLEVAAMKGDTHE